MPIFGTFPTVTMALGLNIVVGYAGPARPRLRRLLRDRGIHRRLVRLAALRPGEPPLRRRRHQPRAAGHPHLDLARARDRRGDHGDGRRADRPADAAASWRLPRDRHARLRGDPAAGGPERRRPVRLQPHERRPGHQPDRPARLRHPERCRPARGLPDGRQPGAALLLGPRSRSSSSRSSAACACAIRVWEGHGSRSARTRPRPPQWACR